ncbi:hypothetical protein K402DRAFT_394052 [Aulographum hederae CBS 113979]|uniref:Transcriptional regulatory protein DEP1 n=1 Tax=Aulographum hederae CBS 113979 TaxID=1176131 RepID=A0A6G1GZ02_9PEZI|nr:hypothetical protein K402DRAFT_394052 [Aulographum hederae CBS 113979]
MPASKGRSRSKTTDADALVKASSAVTPHSPDRTTFSQPPDPSEPHQQSTDKLEDLKPTPDTASDMMSTTTSHTVALESGGPNGVTDAPAKPFAEPQESPSSSLSELDVESDEEDDTIVGNAGVREAAEDDSEAETERLEVTPQSVRKVTEGADSRDIITRTPSKLAQEVDMDEDSDVPVSPTTRLDPLASTTTINDDAIETVNDNMEGSGSPSDREHGSGSRKRKRSSGDVSSLSDISDIDMPAAKRSHSEKDGMSRVDVFAVEEPAKELRADPADVVDDAIIEDEPEADDEEAELEDEATAAPVPIPKTSKFGKGKKKGKKGRLPEAAEAVGGTPAPDAEVDDTISPDNEEEDANEQADETAAERKQALDSFEGIKKQFIAFRERHVNESLAQVTRELELLQEPNSVHPDYVAMLKCIDQRRDDKIKHEDILLKYELGALKKRTVAERGQHLGQYFQTARDEREKAIEKCQKHQYALQRDRRRWGADDRNYTYMYNPDRSVQLQRQIAYNLEVSILAGVAKHVGFPAGPELKPLDPAEIEADLREMNIQPAAPVPTPAPAPPPFARQPFLHQPSADQAAAENEFIEQTPWANPQLAYMQGGAPQPPRFHTGSIFSTPATNGRHVVVNGSGSTVEMVSNPPSSAVAPHFHQPQQMDVDAQAGEPSAKSPPKEGDGANREKGDSERWPQTGWPPMAFADPRPARTADMHQLKAQPEGRATAEPEYAAKFLAEKGRETRQFLFDERQAERQSQHHHHQQGHHHEPPHPQQHYHHHQQTPSHPHPHSQQQETPIPAPAYTLDLSRGPHRASPLSASPSTNTKKEHLESGPGGPGPGPGIDLNVPGLHRQGGVVLSATPVSVAVGRGGH